MFSVKNSIAALESSDYSSLLLGCHRARYAELLSPKEVTELAADAGIETAPAGCIIRTAKARSTCCGLLALAVPVRRGFALPTLPWSMPGLAIGRAQVR